MYTGQFVFCVKKANLMVGTSSTAAAAALSTNFTSRIPFQFACNAHTICDSELTPLGTELYSVISIINHSCSPNSVLVFEGRMARIRATQQIPKGSEVLISYIETGSTMTRQKALIEQYFFTCGCSKWRRRKADYAGDGSRQPSELELQQAFHQGKHIATVAKKLKGIP